MTKQTETQIATSRISHQDDRLVEGSNVLVGCHDVAEASWVRTFWRKAIFDSEDVSNNVPALELGSKLQKVRASRLW
jgi:hypothetical protein